MPPTRSAGRRRAAGPIRRFPAATSRVGIVSCTKALVAASLIGGSVALLSLPVGQASATMLLPHASAETATERSAPSAASRSAGRVSAVTRGAVSAPAKPARIGATPVGVSGVKAVPKPTQTPKPAQQPAGPRAQASEVKRKTSPPKAERVDNVSRQCLGLGVQRSAARLCTAVQQRFGLTSIGGYRAGAGEHGTGQALDLMVSSRSQGDAVAAFIKANVASYDVQYLIWYQRFWEPGGTWDPMDDRGSTTQNHKDHVHVTLN